jgi:hypothetical protein
MPYFFARGGDFVTASKYAIPETTPTANPISPKKPVPNRLSSHCPAIPGNTIIAATARIRDTHSIASVIGEGCPFGGSTGDFTISPAGAASCSMNYAWFAGRPKDAHFQANSLASDLEAANLTEP